MSSSKIEAALDVLGLYAVSGPIIQTFRKSANLKRAKSMLDGEGSFILAPASEFSNQLTVCLGDAEGWVTRNRLKIDFIRKPFRAFLGGYKEEPDDIEPFAQVETGYGITTGGGIRFEVEARFIEEVFDPSDPVIRWVMGKMIRIGTLVDEYIQKNGPPPRFQVNNQEALDSANKMTGALEKYNSDTLARLEKEGIHVSSEVHIDLSTS